MTLSPAQLAMARRKFGRRLAKTAGDLRIIAAEVIDGPDPDVLDVKEVAAISRQVEALVKIASNLDKLGTQLEKSE